MLSGLESLIGFKLEPNRCRKRFSIVRRWKEAMGFFWKCHIFPGKCSVHRIVTSLNAPY